MPCDWTLGACIQPLWCSLNLAPHPLTSLSLLLTAALVLPPPHPLTGGKVAAAAIMAAAASASETALDEVQHMRRYSRFGAVSNGRMYRQEGEAEEEVHVQVPGEGEGNRLLMGQWQHKSEVRRMAHIIPHKCGQQG